MAKGHDIGRALSIVNRFWRGCSMDDEFSHHMGAPMGELWPIISKGRAKAFRKIKRRVKAMTGLKWRMFCREVERRTSTRWAYHNTGIGHEDQFMYGRQ